MPYELRLPGKPATTFETQREAVEAAARSIADDPDASPEIIDLATGNAAAPAADRGSREDLRNKVGF